MSSTVCFDCIKFVLILLKDVYSLFALIFALYTNNYFANECLGYNYLKCECEQHTLCVSFVELLVWIGSFCLTLVAMVVAD